jgi:hypothetical protein
MGPNPISSSVIERSRWDNVADADKITGRVGGNDTNNKRLKRKEPKNREISGGYPKHGERSICKKKAPR